MVDREFSAWRLVCLFLVIGGYCPVLAAEATCDGPNATNVYFVDNQNWQASDANPGSSALPWLTIQGAVDRVGPGDTVCVRQGTYPELVDLTGSSGTEGKSGNANDGYITYAAYPNETVILDGSPFSGWGPAFRSGRYAEGDRAMHYIRIKGFTIRNYPEAGVDIGKDSSRRGSHHIILEDLTIHNNGHGIYIWGGVAPHTTHHIEVRNCDTFDSRIAHGIKFNGDEPRVIGRDQIHDSIIENCRSYRNHYLGIHVSTGNYNITVRNNTSYDNGRQGIAAHEIWDSTYEGNTVFNNGLSAEAEDEGIVVFRSNNLQIRKNIIYNHSQGSGIGLWNKLPNAAIAAHRVEQNIIYNNGAGGDAAGGINIASNVGQSVIYNNSIASNNGVGINAGDSAAGNIFKNNLLFNNTSQVNPGSGNLFDYNLYFPDTFAGKGDHAVTDDPFLGNDPTPDYHLPAGSPAIDKGVFVGLTHDFDGTPIPADAPDIGAYEWVSSQGDVVAPSDPSDLRIE